MQRLAVKQDGDSQARVFEHPVLQKVPPFRSFAWTSRIHAHELIQEREGSEPVSQHLLDNCLLQVILLEDG